MKEYYHIWNSVFKGLPRPFNRLKTFCSDLKYGWEKLTEKDLVKFGIKPEHFTNFRYQRKTGAAFREFGGFRNIGIKTVTIECKEYPQQLHHLNTHLSPQILYYKGELPSADNHFVAIVGTRGITAYGQAVTQKIVGELGKNFVVVSGLARGVDLTAHIEALKKGLKTVAVLGFGLNKLPYHLTNITAKIEKNGAVISEYPPNLMGQKYHFPLRNRIISGMSKGVIVIEAGKPSGALITADYALTQSREVFAVPGDIMREKSKGTNELLVKGGAHPLCDMKDFFEIMEIDKSKNKSFKFFDGDQKLIVDELNKIPLTKNELLNRISLPTAKLTSTLTELELADAIQINRNGKYYTI